MGDEWETIKPRELELPLEISRSGAWVCRAEGLAQPADSAACGLSAPTLTSTMIRMPSRMR